MEAPQGGLRGIGSRWLELPERLVGAAGNGDLGSDHVTELADQALRSDGLLRDPHQPGRAIGSQVVP